MQRRVCVKMARVPMRWRLGELVFGGGAILLGLGIPIAIAFGWEVNPWVLVLIPLAIIGAVAYNLTVVAPTPTGVERPKDHTRGK